MSRIIDEFLEDVKDLNPLPQTAINLSQAINNDSKDVNDFVKIISFDKAVTAVVLKYANSVSSASNTTIIDMKDAVVRLGATRILNAIMGKKLKGFMDGQCALFGYSENELWRHSVASALAAQNIQEFSSKEISSIVFPAALMHDIGKLILSRKFNQKDFQEIVDSIDPFTSFEKAEQKVLGFSHCEVGARLAHKWGLPDQIVSAIENHHTNSFDGTVTDAVRLANFVALTVGEGFGAEYTEMKIGDDIFKRLNVDEEIFDKICVETCRSLDETLALFES